jgi:hypothetical protein
VEAARAAEGAGSVHRELPVTMLDGDLLLEGVADLAFERRGVMTVVDFKTDRPIPRRWTATRARCAPIAAAIQRATGKAVARAVTGVRSRRSLDRPQRRDLLVEIADRGLEHRAMRRRAGVLQVAEGARARELQRGALGTPRRLGRIDGGPASRPPGVLLLILDGFAFPAASHRLLPV